MYHWYLYLIHILPVFISCNDALTAVLFNLCLWWWRLFSPLWYLGCGYCWHCCIFIPLSWCFLLFLLPHLQIHHCFGFCFTVPLVISLGVGCCPYWKTMSKTLNWSIFLRRCFHWQQNSEKKVKIHACKLLLLPHWEISKFLARMESRPLTNLP